jgi:hypothetical protein
MINRTELTIMLIILALGTVIILLVLASGCPIRHWLP